MINRTDNVKGCGVSSTLTPLYPKEVFEENFGLSKSIEVSKKSQIGVLPTILGALANRCWEEKLAMGIKTRHVSPLVKPYGVDSYRRITGTLLGYLNDRLGEISLKPIHQKMANCAIN
jgi:hypothetical protein